jgi:hypothetical protein
MNAIAVPTALQMPACSPAIALPTTNTMTGKEE